MLASKGYRFWFYQSIFFFSAKIASAQDVGNATEDQPLWRTYLECEAVLGQGSMTCDPENALQGHQIRKQIDDILWLMQTEVPCYCDSEQDCNRYDDLPIQSGVVAVFVAFAGGDLPDDLEEIAERIYSRAGLGSKKEKENENENDDDEDWNQNSCDNGLLLIYALDTRALFLLPGSSLSSVFDHLPTHRRRIEPWALIDYLQRMLAVLQKRTPDSVASVRRSSFYGAGGFSGWEVVVGMIAAVIIVTVAGAALLAIFCAGCCRCGDKNATFRGLVYEDQEAACKRYEKECREWTKRARHLAKQRGKMLRQMQKPDWPRKVAEAKTRLAQKRAKSEANLRSADSSDSPDTFKIDQQRYQQQQSAPCYIVSEPSSVYNHNHLHNLASYEDGDTLQADSQGGGTVRSGKGALGIGNLMADAKRERTAKRETQRRDFYFQDE